MAGVLLVVAAKLVPVALAAGLVFGEAALHWKVVGPRFSQAISSGLASTAVGVVAFALVSAATVGSPLFMEAPRFGRPESGKAVANALLAVGAFALARRLLLMALNWSGGRQGRLLRIGAPAAVSLGLL